MDKSRNILLTGAILVGALLLLAACATPTPVVQTQEVTREVPVEVTRVVEVTAVPVVAVVPNEELWAGSAHANKTAEAFVHWDQESPPEVPAACAKCHSTPGFQDFLGLDGSEAGQVDKAAPVGTVITCDACHNAATEVLTSVKFPSGAELTGLGPEARCMQCHQGRASVVQVDESIAKAGLTDDDTVSEDLGFTNIHYFAAAVSRHGTHVKGGYEYTGKRYDVLFDHVRGVDTCVDCHNPHSLKVQVDKCGTCHTGVTSTDDLKNVRMNSSLVDYDGDGDVQEGIYYELEGMRALLYQAIQAYAQEVSKTPIVYETAAYPYFFADPNGNGQVDEGEAVFDNSYKAWTGRLAKAAYNYQTSLKDPGAFAHGGKYILQLMYDSIESLNEKLSTPIDLSKADRIDAGHFAGSEEAFRHWDAEGAVPGTCAKCHTGEGLSVFLKEGTNVSLPPSNGFLCANCHDSLTEFTRYQVNQVRFPSGAMLTFGEGVDSNLCINCHQGRESKVSVDAAIKALGLGPDESSDKLRFRNIHYFAAGATLFGTNAKGVYEYDGQTYLGTFEHGGLGPTQCVQCHSTHGLQVQAEVCAACHKNVEGIEDLRSIRISETDFDGDGDVTEGMAGEIATMHEALYAAIQAYARDKAGAGILYDAGRYPYFFLDADNDGQPDTDAQGNAIAYNAWSPRLLQAGYNYQYVAKDPGQFAHNGKYILQVLYDSLNDIGGDVSGMTRP